MDSVDKPERRGRKRLIDFDPTQKKETDNFFKKDRGRVDNKSVRRVVAKNRQIKADRITRARDMFMSGIAKSRIADELDASPATVGRWVKGISPPSKNEEQVDLFEGDLIESADDAFKDARLAARDEEQQTILDVAENQSSPADKYQAYVAASAIKMLRDSLLNIRGPRTVRELSELDQLIRRNLGLNAKSGGGSGSLTIDISVLNNAKAASGGAKVVVVDAQQVEEADRE
jgi:predicted transcriptional regulator